MKQLPLFISIYCLTSATVSGQKTLPYYTYDIGVILPAREGGEVFNASGVSSSTVSRGLPVLAFGFHIPFRKRWEYFMEAGAGLISHKTRLLISTRPTWLPPVSAPLDYRFVHANHRFITAGGGLSYHLPIGKNSGILLEGWGGAGFFGTSKYNDQKLMVPVFLANGSITAPVESGDYSFKTSNAIVPVIKTGVTWKRSFSSSAALTFGLHYYRTLMSFSDNRYFLYDPSTDAILASRVYQGHLNHFAIKMGLTIAKSKKKQMP